MARMPKHGRVIDPINVSSFDPTSRLATIEWIENGEKVVGVFSLIGWNKAPPEVAAEYQRMINRPPVVLYGRRRRVGTATDR